MLIERGPIGGDGNVSVLLCVVLVRVVSGCWMHGGGVSLYIYDVGYGKEVAVQAPGAARRGGNDHRCCYD